MKRTIIDLTESDSDVEVLEATGEPTRAAAQRQQVRVADAVHLHMMR